MKLGLASYSVRNFKTLDQAIDFAEKLESIPLLDQSTIHAVKQWRFDPAAVSSVAAPVVINVEARFFAQKSPLLLSKRPLVALSLWVLPRAHTPELQDVIELLGRATDRARLRR